MPEGRVVDSFGHLNILDTG